MKRPVSCFVFLLLLAFFIGKNATAGEFAADFKQYQSWGDEGEKEKKGKIFVKGEKSRMEFFKHGLPEGIMIVNTEKNATWLLNTEEKTYMEIDIAQSPSQYAREGSMEEHGFTKESLGTETVSGYSCVKERYTHKDKNMGSMVLWTSKKLSYPVKWENKGAGATSWFQLSNVKEGKVNDSLFDLPKGYKAVTLGQEPDEEEKEGKQTDGHAGKVIKEDTQDLGRDAHGAAKQGVSEGVTESIREGIRGLFRRK